MGSSQSLKSGMKYSRISRAESFPASVSKHSQSRIVSNETSDMGKSICVFSCSSRFRALATSVLTHSPMNPNVPVAQLRTLRQVYQKSLARQTFTLVMMAITGGMALLLGLVGIYGV